MEAAAVLGLLRTVDTALPTGSFTASNGWEAAWRHGWLRDAADARRWLHAQLEELGSIELPHLCRAHRARRPWAVDGHLDRYAVVAAWREESRRAGNRLLELAGERARPCHRAVAAGWLLGRGGVPAATAAAAYAQSVCMGQAGVGVRLGVLTADDAVALIRDLAPVTVRVAARSVDGRVRPAGTFRQQLCGLLQPALASPLFSS
jgi:urease accessory protein UreF